MTVNVTALVLGIVCGFVLVWVICSVIRANRRIDQIHRRVLDKRSNGNLSDPPDRKEGNRE